MKKKKKQIAAYFAWPELSGPGPGLLFVCFHPSTIYMYLDVLLLLLFFMPTTVHLNAEKQEKKQHNMDGICKIYLCPMPMPDHYPIQLVLACAQGGVVNYIVF